MQAESSGGARAKQLREAPRVAKEPCLLYQMVMDGNPRKRRGRHFGSSGRPHAREH